MEQEKNQKITTIKLSLETKQRLDKVKEYRRETYDEILQKMLNILNTCRFSPERARSMLISIDRKKRRLNKQIKIQKKPLVINQRPL